MAQTQTERWTVIGTPPHMQAGDSAERPVSVLHTDPVIDRVVELRLTVDEARALAEALVRHASDAMAYFRRRV